MSTPATRRLAVVLRDQLAGGEPVRLLIATAAAGAPDAAHINVTVDGVQVTVPKLAGVTVTAGKPVYILAGATAMIAIGTVSLA